MDSVRLLVLGMYSFGYATAAVFFLSFWRSTRDRLFAIFAAAFGILFVQAVAVALSSSPTEDLTYLYIIRLAAFLMIFFGILDKKLKRKAR